MEKAVRLKKSSDFKKVFKEGKRFLTPHFVLYRRSNSLPQSRIGISISKTHFRLATRRNRLRRIAKELFRKETSPLLDGYDFVIASRASFPYSNIDTAIKELRELMKGIEVRRCLEMY